ncbi:long-chain fatty acid--CoA ligase [Myxococcota bacterium]|nr:long-chain fatty acid--CoA ligase [Myxococcota bacterium]
METRPWHRFYTEGIPLEVSPDVDPLPALLDRAAARWPERPATIFEGGKVSYRALREGADRFAAALVSLGVRPGDRVALQLPNLPQMVIAYYGVLKAGAVAVMTNPLYVAREIEHQFNDSGARVVLTLDAYWVRTIRDIRHRLPSVEHVVLTRLADWLPFPKNLLFPLVGKKTGLVVDVDPQDPVIWFRDLLQRFPPSPPRIDWNPDMLANLQYTGGTTGLSKGAMLTHRNLGVNIRQVQAWFPGFQEGGETVVSMLPFFHSFGLTVCMNLAVASGATQILVPNPRDIPKLVRTIGKHRPTFLPAVPATFNAINHFPGIDRIDLSSIKACISGSAPLPLEVMERFEQLTGGKITEGFGLSETSPVTHANPLYGVRKPGSIGIPVPSTDARIVDLEEGRREMGVGEDGELVLRGPQVMQGYWNNPTETEGMLRDGWLYTGDIARMDEDGFFYIVGRKKDMIIAGGYNIYPREIDEILYEHPKVLEAAAVGVPDPKRGETVKAFVVLKPGESATAEEIIDYCRSRLAAYKVPRMVEFRAELPKSTVGKVLRRVLQEEEKARAKAG